MIKQIRRYTKFGFVLLLPAYFLILTNSVMNQHTHILPNGIVITHSHPLPIDLNGNKQPHHHHSKKALIFLHYLSIGFYVVSNNSVAFLQFEYPSIKRIVIPKFIVYEIYIDGISERAPPVLS